MDTICITYTFEFYEKKKMIMLMCKKLVDIMIMLHVSWLRFCRLISIFLYFHWLKNFLLSWFFNFFYFFFHSLIGFITFYSFSFMIYLLWQLLLKIWISCFISSSLNTFSYLRLFWCCVVFTTTKFLSTRFLLARILDYFDVIFSKHKFNAHFYKRYIIIFNIDLPLFFHILLSFFEGISNIFYYPYNLSSGLINLQIWFLRMC